VFPIQYLFDAKADFLDHPGALSLVQTKSVVFRLRTVILLYVFQHNQVFSSNSNLRRRRTTTLDVVFSPVVLELTAPTSTPMVVVFLQLSGHRRTFAFGSSVGLQSQQTLYLVTQTQVHGVFLRPISKGLATLMKSSRTTESSSTRLSAVTTLELCSIWTAVLARLQLGLQAAMLTLLTIQVLLPMRLSLSLYLVRSLTNHYRFWKVNSVKVYQDVAVSTSTGVPTATTTTAPLISVTPQSSVLGVGMGGTTRNGTTTSAPYAAGTIASAAASATNPSTVGNFKYFGCAGSSSGFSTFVQVENSPSMSIERCTAACGGYNYAGIFNT
jgi:hypothetical protein